MNYTFNVPETTGISFSFTEDGYFEEARYQFNANGELLELSSLQTGVKEPTLNQPGLRSPPGSNPHCIQAYLLWQHGNYTLESNGSLTTQPIKADGRIQVQDPCAETTTVMTYYYEPGMYQSWAILNDVNHQQYMLQLYDYDGSLLQRMYLTYRPASMWPRPCFFFFSFLLRPFMADPGSTSHFYSWLAADHQRHHQAVSASQRQLQRSRQRRPVLDPLLRRRLGHAHLVLLRSCPFKAVASFHHYLACVDACVALLLFHPLTQQQSAADSAPLSQRDLAACLILPPAPPPPPLESVNLRHARLLRFSVPVEVASV